MDSPNVEEEARKLKEKINKILLYLKKDPAFMSGQIFISHL